MKLGGATLAEALKKWSKGVWVVDDLRFPEGLRRQNSIGPLVDQKLTSALNETLDGQWLRVTVNEIFDRCIIEDIEHCLLGLGPHR